MFTCHFLFHIYIYIFFFFNDTATTEIYTLSLHDALPIWQTLMTSKNIITDAPKCLLRQKHAFKGFNIFFQKNGPDFKIGQTDHDDLKKHNYGWDRKSTRLNSSHPSRSRMPSSAWKKKNNTNTTCRHNLYQHIYHYHLLTILTLRPT